MTINNSRIITAMVTPFHEDGSLALDKLPFLIDYLLSEGTEGLVVSGTTGEAPTLTQEEKLSLFRETVKLVKGRVPIICGVGSNNTQETVDFTKQVAEIEGIAASLCVVPYYNKPSQEGLYQHFKAIAEATDLPMILYNVPGRTGINMSVETTIRLSQLPTIIGTKECTDLADLSRIIEQTSADFLVYTGEDGLALPAKAMGAKGVISVASHVAGKKMQAMYDAYESGEVVTAGQLARQLTPVNEAVFSMPSPSPVKAVLNEWGISVGNPRLPLVACTKEETNKLLKQIER